MSEPWAYFLTWTTYGMWLPGDQRGWVDKHDPTCIQNPDPQCENAAKARLKESSVKLSNILRKVVEKAIRETCAFRGWKIYALAVLSNHVHLIVAVSDKEPKQILRIVKAYGSRALNRENRQTQRKRWWTSGGSAGRIYQKDSLNAAIAYVENQLSSPSWQ